MAHSLSGVFRNRAEQGRHGRGREGAVAQQLAGQFPAARLHPAAVRRRGVRRLRGVNRSALARISLYTRPPLFFYSHM
jgi:hypothetical protein